MGCGASSEKSSVETNVSTEAPKADAPVKVKSGKKIFGDIATKGSIEDFYNIDMNDELGRGGFAIVRKATNKSTGVVAAAKYISKKDVPADELKCLTREIDIMRKVDHPNVIKMFEVFEDDDYVIILTELVDGGELFYKIVDIGSFSENDAARIVKQLCQGVKYLHSMGIAHRDLKPENLLCSGDGADMVIKIADFGLSKVFNEGDQLKTSCGTPDYAAPEVIKMEGEYGKEVDMWAVGVITYVLLCGYPPFYSENQTELFDQIMNAEYAFNDPEWSTVSDNAKDFIKRLLVVEPSERMTAEQALEHDWITTELGEDGSKALAMNSRLGEYNNRRKNGFDN